MDIEKKYVQENKKKKRSPLLRGYHVAAVVVGVLYEVVVLQRCTIQHGNKLLRRN